MVERTIDTVPGETLRVTVGAGGAGTRRGRVTGVESASYQSGGNGAGGGGGFAQIING